MASFCSGGTSQVKPGVAPLVTLSSIAVEAVAILAGVSLPPLLLGLIGGGISFSSDPFCAADPPVDPHPTQQNLFDALNFGDPVRQTAALAIYRQWFMSHYWYLICECATGTTPVAPPLSPPGTSSSDPYLPTGPNEPCFARSYTDNFPVLTGGATIHELTNQLLPTTGTPITVDVVVGGGAYSNQRAWPIPTGVTGVDVHAETLAKDTGLTPPQGLNVKWSMFTAASQTVGQLSLLQANTQSVSDTALRLGQVGVWPTSATHYAIHSGSTGAAGQNTRVQTATIDTKGICSGANIDTACCPPDPSIDARLNQILAYLQFLMNKQQPGASTAWTDGARHSALTGSGRLTFSGSPTAVRVEVTSVPPTAATSPGDPLFYWDMGFITPIAIDVPLRGQRLVFNPENFAIPPQATGVAWSLPPSTVINIVELIPA